MNNQQTSVYYFNAEFRDGPEYSMVMDTMIQILLLEGNKILAEEARFGRKLVDDENEY